MASSGHFVDTRRAATIGEAPSLERFQVLPNGKCRLLRGKASPVVETAAAGKSYLVVSQQVASDFALYI